MNEDILQNINHRIDNALEYSRQLVEDEKVVERVEDLKVQAESYIRKNPLKSVAVGLFTGYVLGKIFSSDEE
jgi:ElaB/YqjD/DUF883 family membrane-anchored ribosome-binding protein